MNKKIDKIIFCPEIFIWFLILTVGVIGSDTFQMDEMIIEWLINKNIGDFWERILSFLCYLVPDDLNNNSNIFFSVWGVAIAVAIFLIEISGSYRCGISLKRITRLYWHDMIFWGEAEYLLLGPLMYISINLEWKLTSFWCVVMAFLGMAYMLIFFQRYMRTDIIKELIIVETKKEINVLNGKKKNITHNEIDMLPISEMLEHITYSKANETQLLIDTMSEVVKGSRSIIIGNSLENTLLVTWVKHIIIHSGIADESEKERTLNFLCKFWEQITEECSPMECQSYSLQMLIPFMDIGSDSAKDMLLRVWKTMNLYSQISIIYLLLYTEFRFWFIDGKIHEWIRADDQNLRFELEQIKKGEFDWNRQIAWQYWLDWSQYSRFRGDIGMEQFDMFSQSVESLKRGKNKQAWTPVLLSI